MNPVSHPSSTLLVPLFAVASALMRDNALLLGGWGIPAVLASLVGLALVLPRQRRSRLRVPAIFFVVYISLDLILLAVRTFFPEPDWERRRLFLHNVVLFFFLAALAQTLFLLFEVLVLEKLGRPLSKIALDLIQFGILMLALLIVLENAGVKGETLFTGSAVLTAMLGFAMRDTLGNLLAGLTLHLKHFQVGDWIQFDDKPHHVGKVTEINWRETKVITFDLAEVILPNGVLANACVRNFTKPEPWVRKSIYVVAPYEVPPNRVQEIILEAIRDSWGVLSNPAPLVATNAFTERGVEYVVRLFTVEFGSPERVDGGALDRIWYAFARNGIEIPVATHAVRMTELPAPPTLESPNGREERRLRLLERVDVFRVLPEPSLRQLAQQVREVIFGRGEVVLRQGDPGQSLYVIDLGEVVISVARDNAPPVEVNRLGPSAFFGEMSLLTGEPRSATVTTAVQSRMLMIDKPAFEAVMRQSPHLAEAISRVLVERQTGLARSIQDSAHKAEAKSDFFRRIREFFSL